MRIAWALAGAAALVAGACGKDAVVAPSTPTDTVPAALLALLKPDTTRSAPVAAGETHVLRILSLPTRVEFNLKAEIVRVSLADHESDNHPRGVAVRFIDIDEPSRRFLEAFIAREPRPPLPAQG